ncbi:MAG: RluA family pseudouridine synthase [Anaerolineales bacterium]
MNERTLRFEVRELGGRLDHVLVEQVGDLSRSRLQQLIRRGLVTVDGSVVTKTGHSLDGGELVEVIIPAIAPPKLVPESIPLEVIFESEAILVVNKPAGMVVHPSPGHSRGTLVHAVLAHVPDIRGVGGEARPGVVHRLDKDTSGLILLAKNDQSHQYLLRQFKERLVDKIYLALVDGEPPTPSGRVEAPIGRDPKRRKRMAVVPPGRGREAVSTYVTMEQFQAHTLLEVRPETGRTHQVRVHMAYLGCPVVGDRVYGRRKPTIPMKRHFLHAHRLMLSIQDGEAERGFEAPVPAELEQVLEKLRDDLRR